MYTVYEDHIMLSVCILYANIYFKLKILNIIYDISWYQHSWFKKKCSPTKVYMKSIGTIAYLASLERNKDGFSERK